METGKLPTTPLDRYIKIFYDYLILKTVESSAAGVTSSIDLFKCNLLVIIRF